jgi:hypothetical protein
MALAPMSTTATTREDSGSAAEPGALPERSSRLLFFTNEPPRSQRAAFLLWGLKSSLREVILARSPPLDEIPAL